MTHSNDELMVETTPTLAEIALNILIAPALIILVPMVAITAVLFIFYSPILFSVLLVFVLWLRSAFASLRQEIQERKSEGGGERKIEQQHSLEVAEPSEEFLRNVQIPQGE
jgi:hypothetical protein